MQLVSFYDKKQNSHGAPVAIVGVEDLKRNLVMGIYQGKLGSLSDFPNDYDVYELSSFDHIQGTFTLEKPRFLFHVGELASEAMRLRAESQKAADIQTENARIEAIKQLKKINKKGKK